MAKAETESPSYGVMERLVIWFLIPLVFTGVLLGALLYIFGYDVVNGALRAASKIPVISSVLPQPKEEGEAPSSPVSSSGTEDELPAEEPPAQMAAEPDRKEQALRQTEALLAQREQTIRELEEKNAQLERQLSERTISEEEYTGQIRQLAGMYAKMSPSKAAPIVEKLTLSESALVLGMMKTDEQVKILEKMDPQKAAEVSMMMKDAGTVRDQEIAALQERLKVASESQTSPQPAMTNDDLGATFAGMTPKSAASVLLELNNANPQKVIAILSSMDNAGRSKVMAAIADQSKETAAAISSSLVQ